MASESELGTVHVLRGGTRERVTAPTPKWHQKPSAEARQLGLDEMPDFGHAYDFKTFMHRAVYQHAWRFCEIGLPEPGCGNGIGGGPIRLIAVPIGQYVWAIGLCESCIDALAEAQREAHPNWREPEPQPYRPEVNIFYEAVHGKGRRQA